MASVCDNWERLVRATVKREQLRSSGQGAVPLSLGRTTTSSGQGSVPSSLGKTSTTTISVNAILQAADAIQDEDPKASKILQQAHSMAQNLDPKSDGIGVLQFKVGLMTVIKQRLAKKVGGQIDQRRDIEHLWEFYQRYTRLHRVGDIQRQELTWRESETFGADFGNCLEIKETMATWRTVVEVMKALSKDADPNGVGKLITEEVRGAISAFRYTNQFPRLPANFEISRQRDADMFDLLECVFGFQRIDEKAMNEVFLKVLDSYIEWCRHLRISTLWNSFEALGRDRKLILVSLYFLIWGNAANFRFLPKCMARELDAMLDHGEAYPAASCRTESGSVSFLEQIGLPIYEALDAKAARNNNRKAEHSAQRSYDDFDEYFWSLACFELSWPMRRNAQILLKPKKGIFASCIGTLWRN
ncbi:callose synthase 10-like [Pyrus ussuriensis x Pyrus communis]|uniref:Callose synthase 10-like n=1 Tax=Pyrus ussuriensis x Pyrus communis TaxID=2448454 RepID=A0A5N5G731_9ROSA|nr:callose synthase 10-like [Pyrus ussuriensis x Pyrus communis]